MGIARVAMTPMHSSRLALGFLLAAQAALVLLNLWFPRWRLIDLDAEHNLPTWFHSGLLALAAVLALDVLRLEARLLARAGQRRGWALAWLGVAGLFGYLAVDESLVIHEGFYTADLRAWLTPASPLQLTLAWLLIFLPGILAAVGFLAASLGARARLSGRLVAWGAAGLGLWMVALTLEGTAKSFFIPRNLYTLEVILEETAESLGTTAFLWGIWRYRLALATWLGATPGVAPRFAVPWRWVAASLLVLALPAAVVAVSIVRSPHVRHKSVGDDHLRAGRLDDAAEAYREALALAPGYARAWDRLGVVEFRRGRLEAAEQALARAEGLDPKSASTANRRGAVLVRQGRHAEAADAFTRATRLDPADADAHRNLGIAFRHLGREAEAEAALRRADALAPAPVTVTSLRVTVPADLPLAYLDHPAVATALRRTRAGQVDLAVAAYRHALTESPDLAAAHLGLANELARWRVVHRLTRAHAPVRVEEDLAEPIYPSVRLIHWVREAEERWTEVLVTIERAGVESPPATADGEAVRHYERAIALGAGAPGHLGLALLAREAGRPADAAAHLAAARALDAALPALQAVAAPATAATAPAKP